MGCWGRVLSPPRLGANLSIGRVSEQGPTPPPGTLKKAPPKRRASEDATSPQPSPAKVKKSASEGTVVVGKALFPLAFPLSLREASSVTFPLVAAGPHQQNGFPGPEPGPARPKGDPADWSVEQVIAHISSADVALSSHADLFRKHVSGDALRGGGQSIES